VRKISFGNSAEPFAADFYIYEDFNKNFKDMLNRFLTFIGE
jgi:hypothetical protein